MYLWLVDNQTARNKAKHPANIRILSAIILRLLPGDHVPCGRGQYLPQLAFGCPAAVPFTHPMGIGPSSRVLHQARKSTDSTNALFNC